MKRKSDNTVNIEHLSEETHLRLKHLWSIALWFHEYTSYEIKESDSENLLIKMPHDISRACVSDLYKLAIQKEHGILPSIFWKFVCYYCLHFYTQFPYYQAIQPSTYKIRNSKRIVDMDKVCASINHAGLSASLLQTMNISEPIYHIQCGYCRSEAIWRFSELTKDHQQEKKQKQETKFKTTKNLASFLSLISKHQE